MKALLVSLAVVALTACMPGALRDVPDEAGGPPAAPDVLGAFGDDPPVTTQAEWSERRAPLLRAALDFLDAHFK